LVFTLNFQDVEIRMRYEKNMMGSGRTEMVQAFWIRLRDNRTMLLPIGVP